MRSYFWKMKDDNKQNAVSDIFFGGLTEAGTRIMAVLEREVRENEKKK